MRQYNILTHQGQLKLTWHEYMACHISPNHFDPLWKVEGLRWTIWYFRDQSGLWTKVVGCIWLFHLIYTKNAGGTSPGIKQACLIIQLLYLYSVYFDLCALLQNLRESIVVFSCGLWGNWNRKAKQLSSKALRPMTKAWSFLCKFLCDPQTGRQINWSISSVFEHDLKNHIVVK